MKEPMFEISVATSFSGAHHLRGYNGPCGNPHGHNWDVEVFLRGSELDEIGMLADFSEIKSALRDVLVKLDHSDLNKIPELTGVNPTSENLARYIHGKLSVILDSAGRSVCRVRVSETHGTSASYIVPEKGE